MGAGRLFQRPAQGFEPGSPAQKTDRPAPASDRSSPSDGSGATFLFRLTLLAYSSLLPVPLGGDCPSAIHAQSVFS